MYEKVSYWSSRKDPNSEQSKKTTSLQVKWTEKHINTTDNILEYGPGVLRLVDLYKNLDGVSFYDISGNYKSIVEEKCVNNNIKIKQFIVDNSGNIKTPFNNNQFDIIVCSEVLLHSPDNEIVDLMLELSRIGKKVIITTWYDGGKHINSGHCWTRDYKKLIDENGLKLLLWEEDLFENSQLGFIYTKD